ncbi:ABC transporter substrate-binding protein [Microvirga calopogonii]|uniref:ABC transporter substrate-binding protein n=1 Tax=Microvirga calopogonii TaxID=2078013 RepID=UPI000E0D6579|nr:ABC transporter substrate-binding protein [Microvirga calopogonii]
MWTIPTSVITCRGLPRRRARFARRSVLGLLGGAALTLLTAVSGHQGAIAQSAPPTKFDFAGSVTWLGQVPVMIAIEKGFFKEQGVDVEFKTILSSGDRIAALTAGSVAFSNLGRVSVVAEMARGNQSFYYFANIDDSPGNEGCWARPGIASIKDLKGKKVAANTSAEITLAGLLRASGMTQKDIQYINLSPNEMAPALAKGDLDAACVWQPLLGGLQQAVPDGKLLGTDKDTDTYAKYQTMASPDIVIISRKLVDQYPEQARKLAVAVMKGADFVNESPDETAKLVAHYFKKPPEEVLAGIKSFQYFGLKNWPEHIKLHTQQMQDLAQWLYDSNKIGNLPDVKKWENVSFLPKPNS